MFLFHYLYIESKTKHRQHFFFNSKRCNVLQISHYLYACRYNKLKKMQGYIFLIRKYVTLMFAEPYSYWVGELEVLGQSFHHINITILVGNVQHFNCIPALSYVSIICICNLYIRVGMIKGRCYEVINKQNIINHIARF